MRNRRLFLRRNCSVKCVLEGSDGTRQLGLISQVSLGGVKVVSGVLPVRREMVVIGPAVGAEPAIPCAVRWAEAEAVGLRFECSLQDLLDSWLLPHLATFGWRNCDLMDRREHLRIETDLEARVEHDGLTQPGRVLNLSSGGLLLESAAPLPSDEVFRIGIAVGGRRFKVSGRLTRPGCRRGDAWRHSVRFEKPAERITRALRQDAV